MRIVLGAVVAVAMSLFGAGAASAQSCDRACLSKTLDQYLLGVIRHDPKVAPLAANYRGTENGVEVKAGEGTWKSVTGLGSVQRRYFDPVSGQAAYFGLVDEGAAGPMVTTVRVKVVGRKVVEAEWLMGRRGEALYSPAGLIAEPPAERVLPREKRANRATLQKAANSYFDGLAAKDGKIVEHNAGCTRLENGTKVTQRTPPAGATAEIRAEFQSNDCAGGFERQTIAAVVHRRFPVIDEEAQVVLGIGMFLRPPGSTRERLLLSEFFVTSGGKIDQIYAAMKYIPHSAPESTGW